MRLLSVLQLIWALGLASFVWLAMGRLALDASLPALGGLPGVYLLFTGIYLVACLGTFWNLRWAWLISTISLLLIWLHFAAQLAVNFHALLFSDLYKDSPGTLIVLAINLVPTFLPATILLLLTWWQRDALLAAFGAAKASTRQ